jgi:hypothetical protein
MKRIWASLLGAVAAGGLCPASAWAADPSSRADQNAFDAVLLEANRRFVEGDLEGALRALEPACAQSDRAECAFSLGAIQHGLGHCAEALGHYRTYRQLAPEGEHIAEVTAALEEVESRCGEANASMSPAAPAAPGALLSDSGLPSSLDPSHSAPASAPPPPLVAPSTGSTHTPLVAGSLVLSGAAAATSVVFGILAAQSASHCAHARAYDESYIDACEVQGPRYQRLWQGFALASGGFLGIGVTIWWFDANSEASLGVSQAGLPALQFQRRF